MKKKITYNDLKKMNPCYEPEEIGITKNYSATIPEFIKEYRNKVKQKQDIIWALCRNDYMTDKDMRLFAVWCAREALKLIENPDPRSVEICNVAERFANGEATQEELSAAGIAACSAARSAAGSAARSAAGTAAWSAAWSAVESARPTACSAARSAARAAAWAARTTA